MNILRKKWEIGILREENMFIVIYIGYKRNFFNRPLAKFVGRGYCFIKFAR